MEIGQKIKIPKNTKICNNFWSSALGLMFAKKPAPALLVSKKENISGIHMFFVFFPLDIIWLDSEYKIVDIKRHAKPFTGPYYPKKPAKYVLELPVYL